jgi:hypothetical protein
MFRKNNIVYRLVHIVQKSRTIMSNIEIFGREQRRPSVHVDNFGTLVCYKKNDNEVHKIDNEVHKWYTSKCTMYIVHVHARNKCSDTHVIISVQ